ncbi:MAG: hypothetical protein JWQ04_547 [Pedosphaera sp.]|nr:hypothetical protein [Pedosphaera sp.]
MQFKIELKYFYGWDDAGWTDEPDGDTKPTRFETVGRAQEALEEHFAHVKTAVAAGNMDTEENPNDYRIVAVNN